MTQPYTLSPNQVQTAISGHNLRTYTGWLAAARSLLADAPVLTGLVESVSRQLVLKVAFNGKSNVYAYWDEKQDGVYLEEYLSDFDSSAWNSTTESWDGVSVDDNIAVLMKPVFVSLRHP